MTQNELKAKLDFLQSLEEASKKITKEIENDLGVHWGILPSKLSNMIMQSNLLGNLAEGDICKSPCLEYHTIDNISLSVVYPEGDKISAYLRKNECDTVQTGALYCDKDGSVMDLCMAERKEGELAEIYNKAPDNKDINLYLWGDPYTELYTYEETIKYEDIESALENKLDTLE